METHPATAIDDHIHYAESKTYYEGTHEPVCEPFIKPGYQRLVSKAQPEKFFEALKLYENDIISACLQNDSPRQVRSLASKAADNELISKRIHVHLKSLVSDATNMPLRTMYRYLMVRNLMKKHIFSGWNYCPQ